MRNVFLLVLFLILSADVYAATPTTRHLTPGCSNNGDGTGASCAASNGAAGAYNHMDSALNDIASDFASFVSSDVIVTLVPHTGTAVDQFGQVDFGATTDATRYLIIQTAGVDRSNGTYSGYRIECTFGDYCIRLSTAKVVIDGIALKGTVPDGSGRGAGITLNATSSVEISNNFFWYAQASGSANSNLRNTPIDGDSVAGVLKARNNIIFNWKEGIHIRTIFQTGSDIEFMNNTIVDSRDFGIAAEMDGSTDTLRMYNNLLKGSTTADYTLGSSANTYNHGNNSTSDASSPDGAGFQTKTFTFVNAGSRDFHITSGDTGAKGLGTSLAADSGYPFTDDVDGATRGATWDIGADQITAGAGGAGSLTTLKVSGTF